jgi:predicted nucleic acid-binding protein
MGSLILPARPPAYLDAQGFIYTVELHPTYGPLLDPLWAAVHQGRMEVVSSELTILETLVKPIKDGDTALVTTFEQFFRRPGVRLIPITPTILREAARLRASIASLRTPDSIHAATALTSASSIVITNALRLRTLTSTLPLLMLQDLLP